MKLQVGNRYLLKRYNNNVEATFVETEVIQGQVCHIFKDDNDRKLLIIEELIDKWVEKAKTKVEKIIEKEYKV